MIILSINLDSHSLVLLNNCIQLFTCRYQIPDEWPYQEARRLFKEPSVLPDDDQNELKWSPPDEEVVSWQTSVTCFAFLFVRI